MLFWCFSSCDVTLETPQSIKFVVGRPSTSFVLRGSGSKIQSNKLIAVDCNSPKFDRLLRWKQSRAISSHKTAYLLQRHLWNSYRLASFSWSRSESESRQMALRQVSRLDWRSWMSPQGLNLSPPHLSSWCRSKRQSMTCKVLGC
jgi:hypothetical protein